MAKSKSKVNEANNYSKPMLRKRLYAKILREDRGGPAGKWSARKAQLLVREYEAAGGGYTS